VTRVPQRPCYALVTALAGLTWSSLAFGGVYPWAYWPLLVLCATSGLLGLCQPGRSHSEIRPLLIGCAGLVAVVVMQLVPVTQATAMVLSPSRDRVFAGGLFDTVAETGAAPDAPSAAGTRSRALSINPHATRRALTFVVAFALLLLGTARVLDNYRARWIARGIIWLSVTLAFAGIVQQARATDGIYGFWQPYYGGVPFGPFVNRNHFAGWMLMALPLAVGYLFGGLNHASPAAGTSLRERVLWWSSREASHLVLIALGIVVMGASLVMSRSRSGIGCCALALLVFLAAAAKCHTRRRQRFLLNLVLIAVATLSIGWAGVGATVDRFATTDTVGLDGRARIWRDTLRIITTFPLVGTGLNAYPTAMAVFQTDDPSGSAFEAHNDYLQLAGEGGVLLCVAAGALLLVLMTQMRRRFRQCAVGSREYWIRVGAMTGLVAIAAQELVDFSLHIPADASLFVLLCSIAVYPSSTRRSIGPAADSPPHAV
jgi:O-antigen ligase